MKINGKIITSIEGLSRNFNFFEIWQKLPVFKRDINPRNMFFTEDKKEIFQFFEFAEDASFSENKLTLRNLCLPLSKEQEQVAALNALSKNDRIRIISLFALVEKDIPVDQIKDLAKPLSDFEETIILSHGKSIRISGIKDIGGKLSTKKIIVSPESPNESFVGDICLHPGDVTFGIFSDNSLIKVCPNELSNLSYHLKFHLSSDNRSKLIVTNLSTGRTIAEYPDCTYFGTLRDDNFVIINKGNVDCFNDQHLMNMIRKKIGIIDEPQYFDITSSSIIVTLKNNGKITINY